MNAFWHNLYYKIFRSTGKLMMLIIINVAVFLIINIPLTIIGLFETGSRLEFYINDYLALPAYLPKLLTRPWTIITHMFMHRDVFHILFNMLWFYWLGQIFEEFLGKKRIVGLYLLGGLTGAFFFVASYNIFPLFNHPEILQAANAIGASAAIMAVIIAAATIVPDYTIFLIFIGPVKLKWLALFFVITDFLSIVGPNAGGEIAHLGGALFGFLYVKQLQNGNDWIATINKLFQPRSKLKVASTNRDKSAVNAPRQEDVDKILDKISKTGYDNLTAKEKEILFRASKK